MAIRRPPTTFSDTISTADIADDAITGGKLANDIAISTTGNIATTGSGALTVAGNTTLSGTYNLGSNPTVTLGSNATFPAGHVLQVQQNYVTQSQVNVSSTANMSSLSNSYYTFTWGVSITTIRANSKIALIGHLGNAHLASGHSNSEINLSILRYKDGTKEAFVGGTQAGYSSGGPPYGMARITQLASGEKAPAISFMDAPADVAGTVLQYRFACFTLSGSFNIQGGTSSSLMAMEIAV